MNDVPIFGVVIVAIIVYLIVRALLTSDNDSKFCIQCGYEGSTKSFTPGSIWIEIILWLCFIIPGLIYSTWRLTSRKRKCSSCGQVGHLVEPDSPFARKAKRDFGLT